MGAVFILRNPKAGRGEYMKWLHFDYKGGGVMKILQLMWSNG